LQFISKGNNGEVLAPNNPLQIQSLASELIHLLRFLGKEEKWKKPIQTFLLQSLSKAPQVSAELARRAVVDSQESGDAEPSPYESEDAFIDDMNNLFASLCILGERTQLSRDVLISKQEHILKGFVWAAKY
jgi:hypothetical protein